MRPYPTRRPADAKIGGMKQKPKPPQPEQMGPLNWLGRFLALVTCLFTFCIALPVTWWVAEQSGGTFPRIIVVVPVVVLGFGFWAACVKLCSWLGAAIEKPRKP